MSAPQKKSKRGIEVDDAVEALRILSAVPSAGDIEMDYVAGEETRGASALVQVDGHLRVAISQRIRRGFHKEFGAGQAKRGSSGEGAAAHDGAQGS